GDIAAIRDSDLFPTLAAKLGVTPGEAARLLWDTYHPWQIWAILASVGFISMVGLFWLDRNARR
ncbi:MAG TPA: hypothetical protein PKH10_09135, partial [bacterium]|nr:hypothetical protein [bacterium]